MSKKRRHEKRPRKKAKRKQEKREKEVHRSSERHGGDPPYQRHAGESQIKQWITIPKRLAILPLMGVVNFPNSTVYVEIDDPELADRIKRDQVFVLLNLFPGEKIADAGVGVLEFVTEISEERDSTASVVAGGICRLSITDVREIREHRALNGSIFDCSLQFAEEKGIPEERWLSPEFQNRLKNFQRNFDKFNVDIANTGEKVGKLFSRQRMYDRMEQCKGQMRQLIFLTLQSAKVKHREFTVFLDQLSATLMALTFEMSPSRQIDLEFLRKMRAILYAENVEGRMFLLGELMIWASGRMDEIIGLSPAPTRALQKREDSDLPDYVRERIAQVSRSANPNTAEGSMNLTYLEWLRILPWNKRTEDEKDISRIRVTLDKDHYGLEEVKERIIGYMAVRMTKPDAKAPIIFLVGPPGVGKTSLGKSIARATGRKFVRRALGGMKDEAGFRGHRRTYIGSMPGEIIAGLREADSKNPVFMLDEVDKLGEHGMDRPAFALLEILDPEQNRSFKDHYLDLPFDLSEVFFIITANTTLTIDKAILDRVVIIELSAYTEEEKVVIAESHIVPKALDDYGLEPENLRAQKKPVFRVEFTRGALGSIVGEYTNDAGMRQTEQRIKQILEKIARRLQEGKLEELFVNGNGNCSKTETVPQPQEEKDRQIPVLKITARKLKKFLDKPRVREWLPDLADLPHGVCPVLTVDSYGQGGVVTAEVVLVSLGPGEKGLKIKRTGLLAQVMKESIGVAVDRLNRVGGVLEGAAEGLFIHIHVPEGAIPKDGPSAGIAEFVALYSSLYSNRAEKSVPVKPLFSVTGEIPLARFVSLPVGGITAKLLAARKVGIREVAIPLANEKDIKKLKGITVVMPEDLKTNGKSWSDYSREEKPEGSFTVYCIEKPEDALEIAFPDDYPPRKDEKGTEMK